MKIPTRKPLLITSIMMLLSVQHFGMYAQTQIPDSVVKERIQYIQTLLNEGKQGANTWWNGWLVAYSAATVGQGMVGLWSNNKGTRQDMGLGAATTFLGAAGQLILPMTPGKAPDKLTMLTESTPEERLAKLMQAEDLLQSSADREITGRSWQSQTVCGVVNLSSGLVTWLGFKRTVWSGIGNFALNTAITEAQIFTQPTRAIRDHKKYLKRYSSENDITDSRSQVDWYVLVYPGRVGIRIVF
jgi:hypothetical protein